MNRRNFLKNSLIGLSGASVIPVAMNEKHVASETQHAHRSFVYRTLGKTGIKLPIVSMGTGDTSNPNLVKAALDQGIVLLATSQYYGNGNNESMIGEVVKDRERDSYVIMTSAMPADVDHKQGLFGAGNKTDTYIQQFESSLKRLQLDAVDIFLLPFAGRRESVFFEPLLRAMEEIKKQGKARFIGIATHSYETEAIKAAADTKIYDVVMTAYNFRTQNPSEMKEAISYAAASGLGVIAMKTMAGGFWDKERTQPINTKAALKWVFQDPNIHTAVPGFTSFDEMLQDIALMEDLELTEEEKSDLKLASTDNKTGLYCQQCGTCILQCKNGLDIPTLMRSYMYAHGYRNLSHARNTLRMANVTGNPCTNCNPCSVNCTNRFNVKEKIQDVIRLENIPADFMA